MRLLTGKPGWSTSADVVVIGSGVAGLTTALNLRSHGLSVLLVTKARIDEGSTKWAQGGIAAALGPGDTPDQHKKDTLIAGAGLCDSKAVDVLVSEGPEAVRKLIAQGAVFDKSETGEIALTREGGHLRDRILHAGGDATGAEVSRALLTAVKNDRGIEIIEHALAIDALKSKSGRVCGVLLHVIGAGSRDGVGSALARAVVVATGGLGQVYSQTTNPAVSTGDGVALALRAGAKVADVEFIQFHPTVLWRDLANRGQQPLISEAVRGEGAILLNHKNEQFMIGKHPQADLAPRDVVAKEIFNQMQESGQPYVWLDALKVKDFQIRFPTIYASCMANGIDPTIEKIPVAPASHYASGGVKVDLNGKPMVQLLLKEDCTVTIGHSKTKNLKELCKKADIVVVAAGRANLVKGDWIKKGAIVIDVGINRVKKKNGYKIIGDVEFKSVVKKAKAITPVPGGVGPVTIACLLKNTLKAFKNINYLSSK